MYQPILKGSNINLAKPSGMTDEQYSVFQRKECGFTRFDYFVNSQTNKDIEALVAQDDLCFEMVNKHPPLAFVYDRRNTGEGNFKLWIYLI
jgi:hypothetical protein